MSLGRTYKLNSGYSIPAIGLGTWLSKPHEVENAVESALRAGYRHIDAAAVYQNENEVGNGWKNSGVPREQIFITSKLWNTHHHPEYVEEAVEKTLKDLRTDYLDLYLIHWPVAFEHTNETLMPINETTKRFLLADVPISDTWAALEKLVAAGKLRSIGVSNFTQDKIEELLKTAKIPPAVNQIEAHPYLQQPEQSLNCLQNILSVAYSPLGNNIYNAPRVVDDPSVKEIADKLGKDPAALLISWAVQRGTAVLPKSVTPSRIKSNFQDFIIPEPEFEALNKLDRNQRYNFPFRWGIDVFGEVGDEEVVRRAEEHAANDKWALPLVERTNNLSLDEFVELYVPSDSLEFSQRAIKDTHTHEDEEEKVLHYSLDIYTAESIPAADFEACFELIEATSSKAYTESGWGWSPKKKKKEMRLPDMRYLILREGPRATQDTSLAAKGTAGRFLGFTSFMVTYEDGKEVIYCYEIHISAAAQNRGLGSQLLSQVVSIGRRVGLEKVMLTVFNSNIKASRFYDKLGFSRDEFSPLPRRTRNGMIDPDYTILSRSLKPGGW
ncbi:hypothetical protein BBP40_008065 [Aspergillus hancockii]|nr:hypothetical protein BBP40_008065 [Aspergillus hancockii]